MGGICGIVNFDGRFVDKRVLRRMAGAATHRGPDGIRYLLDGDIGLTHLALNITPESYRERQPLVSPDGNLVLTADARIDNRNELISILMSKAYLADRDSTDADLILAAYRCWGTDCAVHLIGDFAFAIWDRSHQRLFAARDPMAMRAFYYRVESRSILFASEVKQILAVPGVPIRIFEPAVGAHLAGPFGLTHWTFYDGIAQLPPAHALIVNAGVHKIRRYWDIDPDCHIKYADENQYAEHFLEIFKEAVRCRLRSVKPVGIFLSGGMDSGSIASTAGWLLQRNNQISSSVLHPYCWAFEELTPCDERHISDGIVRHFGFPVTNVRADQAYPLRDYPAHGPDRDEPFIWVYQALIERTLEAAQSAGMGWMLSGDRGDEMVGDWVFDHLGLLRTGRWRELWQELLNQGRRNKWALGKVIRNSLLMPLVVNVLSQVEAAKLFRIWRRMPGKSEPSPTYPPWVRPEFARQVGLSDIIEDCKLAPCLKGYAYRQRYQRIFSFAGKRIAAATERTRARYSLGFADPWSDLRIGKFVLATPQWVIQRVREPKRLSRQAMRGIMPEAVRKAVRKIEPVLLFERGFNEKSKDAVFDLITDSHAAARGYIDQEALCDAYESYLRGEPQRYDFWWALTLEMWLRQYWSHD